jgi:hypothetical protein
MKTSTQLSVLIPNLLLELFYPSAPTSTKMDFTTLKRTLNHPRTTKLVLQPTLANHHLPSLMKRIPNSPLPPSQKRLMIINMINTHYFLLVSTLPLMSMIPFPTNMDQHHLHPTMSNLLTISNATPSSKR